MTAAPGWWQATDGRWYPPETHPDYSKWDRDDVDWVLVDEDDSHAEETDHTSDPTYEDPDGVHWWWNGESWEYWRDDDWVPFPGQFPSGLIEADTTIPVNLRVIPPGYWRSGDGRLYPLAPGTMPHTPAAAPRTHAGSTVPAGGWFAIVGGGLLTIGPLLPWVTVGLGAVTRNGFQLGQNDTITPDGPIVLILGIVTIVAGIVRLTGSLMPGWIQRSPVVTGIGAGLVLWANWSGLQHLVRTIQGAGITAAVGYGYWICAVGAAVAVIAGLVLQSNA
jgi:hypothetical protein